MDFFELGRFEIWAVEYEGSLRIFFSFFFYKKYIYTDKCKKTLLTHRGNIPARHKRDIARDMATKKKKKSSITTLRTIIYC